MVLTFKSSGETEIAIVERDSDGAVRIARATQDRANPRFWRAQLEHPNALPRPCSNVFGSHADTALALAHYLAETRTEFLQEKNRGFRPPAAPKDTNRPVDEFGQAIGAPVRNIPRTR
jgi:hypothetical protein